MANRTPIFLGSGGSLAGVSGSADTVSATGVQSNSGVDATLSRGGVAGTTVTVGGTAVTLGSTLASLDVGAATFNLANSTATTLNIGGASTATAIGSVASGTTTVGFNLHTGNDITMAGDSISQSGGPPEIRLFETTGSIFIGSDGLGGGSGVTISIGASGSGTTTLHNTNTVVAGSLAANGGAITTDDTTFALVNTTATTVNFAGGASTALNMGHASGTTTIAGNTVVSGDLAVNGGDLTTSASTFNLINGTATTVNFAQASTSMIMGATTGETRIRNNARVVGNLVVEGTTTTIDTETLNVEDNHIYINNGYTAVSAETGGMVVNYLPTSTNSAVATGGFVAGVAAVSNPTVTISAASVFAVGDLIQVSGANNAANNGLFEVLSNASATMTIRGVGLTATVEDFTQNQFVTDTTVAGSVRKVNVSIMRAGTDGIWEVGQGSSTGITFSDLSASGSVTLQTAYVNGNTITTSAGEGNLTVNGTEDFIVGGTVDISISSTGTITQTGAGQVTLNGNVDATNGLDVTTANLTVGGANFSVAVGSGDITSAGDAAINGGDITTTAGTATLFNTGATTLSIGGAATSLSMGAATGTLTIGNPTITGTNATTFNMNGASPSIATTSTGTASVFNTNATTLNIGGAGTTISIGAGTGTTTINNANTVVTGDLAVNGGDMTSSATTFNLLNATVTTLNLGGAASINMGSSGGTTLVAGNLTVNGSVTLGDANTDNVAVNGEFTTSLIPDVDVTYNLGSATKRWNDLFIENLDSLSVGTTYVAGTGGVTAARIVYKNGTANEVLHADADALSTSNTVVGVARASAGAAANVTVDYAGVVTMDAATGITITAGDIVYLAVGTTGEVTNVAPTGSGDVVLVVGIAKTTSASGGTFLAQFQPRTPYVNP